ncbi:MAG: hypothetical protein GY822_12925 [Deltaproteobacteria bacterium]|nr:hypothetical protein [Deltaproteobacteria bacterium]
MRVLAFFSVQPILFGAGCGLGVDGIEPSVEPAVVAPEPEAPPSFETCEDNGDCQGGELCVVNECRTSCSANDECEGFYGICDVDTGMCVVCTADADCAADEKCSAENLCAFFCDANDDCAADEFCDLDNGQCAARECEENSDCQGGYACDGFLCVSIEELVCDAETTVCDGSYLVTCNSDGTEKTITNCGAEQVCVPSAEGAACEEKVCDTNAIGCDDDDTAFFCNTAGTEKTSLSCGSNQYYQEGVCRDDACAPSSVSCDGNLLVQCDDVGASQTTVSCLDVSECASEFGCQCTAVGASASCVARICVPGGGQCIGGGVRICNDVGDDYLSPANCDDGEECVSGSCLPAACSAGEASCSGNTLLTCNAGESGYDNEDCTTNNAFCSTEGGAHCQVQVCTPGAVMCTSDLTGVEVCDVQGMGASVTTCDMGKSCVGGSCISQICMPDTTRREGSSVASCNASGTQETFSPCDGGSVCIGGICETAVADSCAGKCRDAYNPSLVCQCNDSCGTFGNCCADFVDVCSVPEATCEGKCGNAYDSNLVCQCNDSCVNFGNCCSDYDAICGTCSP